MDDSKKPIIQSFKKWLTQVGHDHALGALVSAGVGTTTAYLLVNGRYKHKPSRMLERVLEKLTQPKTDTVAS